MPLEPAWLDRLAHDLRGPLSPIQTAAHLLRDPAVGPGQRDELFAVLERQVQRLSAMIDELGDLARTDTETPAASAEAVDVGMLVADAAGRMPARPPRVEFAPDAQAMEVEGDPRRIAQLFGILLGLQASRGRAEPVQARIERRGSCMRMACTVHCSDATDELAGSLLAAPHPDPPDGALGFGLVIAAAIARGHGGGLRARASGPDTLELVLELPARSG